ncbi:glycosyltransferase family 4 protein [Aurantimonas coralicida]|uniref:glycosyltransferase family 4 protein n=1 Tax=Aurantimonas coralicida TaxID=182270 RepID=UPI0004625110|nr:glycosyltransferase family 1 protein [Aurantimonas coralicida]
MKIGIDGRNLTSPLSGISRYVVCAASALVARGHEITLYLPSKPHPSIPSLDFAAVRIDSAQSVIARHAWSLLTLPRLVRRDRPTLFWGPAHRLPPMRIGSIPKALTIHDLVWIRAPETMRRSTLLGEQVFMRAALSRTDLVLADSDATKKDIEEIWPRYRVPIRTVHAGWEIRSSACVAQSECADGSLPTDYLLFVGTLEPRKNLSRLLEAWALLTPEQRAGHKLLIIGARGWGKTDLRETIERLGLGTSVILSGFVDEGRLDHIYRCASGLVMPSLYEGFGLPVVEAQARGVSVLVSNIASLPEVAGKDAILVDPRDIKSIRDGLVAIIKLDRNDPDRRRRALENASHFTWQRMAEKTERAFEDLLTSRRTY